MSKSGVYGIRNKKTKKIYVGSSLNINRRWTQHKCALKTNSHHSPKLQQAWSEDGAGSFEWVTLEETSNLLEREQYFLDLYKSYESENGYNVMRFSMQFAECRIDSPENKTVHLSVRVDPRFSSALKEWCELEGISQNQYIVDHLKELEKDLADPPVIYNVKVSRIDDELFESWCQRNGTTPSEELRAYIKARLEAAGYSFTLIDNL